MILALRPIADARHPMRTAPGTAVFAVYSVEPLRGTIEVERTVEAGFVPAQTED